MTQTRSAVERDAREFGLHVKQGGWRLGLLVARNVQKGNGGRGRHEGITTVIPGKVSAQEFARMSSTTAPRVLRHLDAWERAADAGHVPHAAELTPGEEPALDVEALPAWESYYDASGAGGRPRDGRVEDALTILDRQTPETRARVTTQLLADPDTRDHVVGRTNPEGVAAVEAMHLDLRQRQREPVEDAPLPPPPAFAVRFWKAVNAVQEANVELERFGVRGLDARPETRAAAERMASQTAVLRDAVVDYVVSNIATVED